MLHISVAGTSTLFVPSTARSATTDSPGFLKRAALRACLRMNNRCSDGWSGRVSGLERDSHMLVKRSCEDEHARATVGWGSSRHAVSVLTGLCCDGAGNGGGGSGDGGGGGGSSSGGGSDCGGAY